MTDGKWRWEEGPVDISGDHIEITYGNVGDDGPKRCGNPIPVALLAAPRGRTFNVQFLIGADCEIRSKMLAEVRKELEFYLVELSTAGRPPPWEYAKYHCGTSANLYSAVHWNFKLRQAEPSLPIVHPVF